MFLKKDKYFLHYMIKQEIDILALYMNILICTLVCIFKLSFKSKYKCEIGMHNNTNSYIDQHYKQILPF